MAQTEKARAARIRNTENSYDRIVEAMSRYGRPLTREGIAEETGYPVAYLYRALIELEARGRIRVVPDTYAILSQTDRLKLYEVVRVYNEAAGEKNETA